MDILTTATRIHTTDTGHITATTVGRHSTGITVTASTIRGTIGIITGAGNNPGTQSTFSRPAGANPVGFISSGTLTQLAPMSM
jgi:hypothetical protein